jgi:hypothetical protein
VKNRTLFLQFFGVHILILFLAGGLVSFYAWHTSKGAFVRQWVRELDMQARLAAALLPDEQVLGGGNVRALKELPPGCRAGDNANAFVGGFRLWPDAARRKTVGERT